MARPGISYEDIIKAIAILKSQGNTPSINSVRDIIGRGSATTISKFLKQWRQKQVEIKSSTVKKELEQNMQPTEKNISLSDGFTRHTASTKIQSPSCSKDTTNVQEDPIIQALLNNSHALSNDILSNMSEEWSMILKENTLELKVRKLYSALVKEQTRRESAEQIAKEARIYAETLKEQTTKRISDLRNALEGQITFLNGEIRQLKRESEQRLEYYRKQLEKSNDALAEKNKSACNVPA